MKLPVESQGAYRRDLREEYRESGFCGCGQVPVLGRRLCPRCAEVSRRNADKYRRRHPRYAHEYYMARKAAKREAAGREAAE